MCPIGLLRMVQDEVIGLDAEGTENSTYEHSALFETLERQVNRPQVPAFHHLPDSLHRAWEMLYETQADIAKPILPYLSPKSLHEPAMLLKQKESRICSLYRAG